MVGLLCDFWKDLSSGGENYSPKYLYSPFKIIIQPQTDYCTLMSLMMDIFSPCPSYDREHASPNTLLNTLPCSLKTFLLLLSISANVAEIPVASGVVVGVLVFTGRKTHLKTWQSSTFRVHTHAQESLVKEIQQDSESRVRQGLHWATLLILKMCCLEARKHSEVYVTFSPLEI